MKPSISCTFCCWRANRGPRWRISLPLFGCRDPIAVLNWVCFSPLYEFHGKCVAREAGSTMPVQPSWEKNGLKKINTTKNQTIETLSKIQKKSHFNL